MPAFVATKAVANDASDESATLEEKLIETLGGPASLGERLAGGGIRTLATIPVEIASLDDCMASIQTFVAHLRNKAGDSLVPETLTLELAISSTGKVGILGTGIDVECAAKIEVSFKIK